MMVNFLAIILWTCSLGQAKLAVSNRGGRVWLYYVVSFYRRGEEIYVFSAWTKELREWGRWIRGRGEGLEFPRLFQTLKPQPR